MVNFSVKKQKIEVLEQDAVASGQICFVDMHFTFDEAWDGLHKVVQITQQDETYNLVLGTECHTCKLPAELSPGTVSVSVYGYSASKCEALRATTVPVYLKIQKSGLVSDGTDPIPPTPDLYQQLLYQISQIQNDAGEISIEEIDSLF